MDAERAAGALSTNSMFWSLPFKGCLGVERQGSHLDVAMTGCWFVQYKGWLAALASYRLKKTPHLPISVALAPPLLPPLAL